jgi:hypothetical protein
MAKFTFITCDHCGKVTNEDNPVIAKLFLTPVLEGRSRADHSGYTGHMTIGLCCKEKILPMNWKKRQTRTEYHNGRKLRTGHTVGKSTRRKTSKAQ